MNEKEAKEAIDKMVETLLPNMEDYRKRNVFLAAHDSYGSEQYRVWHFTYEGSPARATGFIHNFLDGWRMVLVSDVFNKPKTFYFSKDLKKRSHRAMYADYGDT